MGVKGGISEIGRSQNLMQDSKEPLGGKGISLREEKGENEAEE